MASSATSLDPLLVAVKSVDPAKYPFYGSVVLEPAMPLNEALTDSTVAVGDDLLLRLHLKIGRFDQAGQQHVSDCGGGDGRAGPADRIVCGGTARADLGARAGRHRAAGAGHARDAQVAVQGLQPTASGQPASDARVARTAYVRLKGFCRRRRSAIIARRIRRSRARWTERRVCFR